MSRKVADLLWEMLSQAGVKRCYGIVGDALNPVIDALRRNGKVEFVHVRNEEYGVFAAVAEAYLTGNPVAVCGTAGAGVVHLINGLLDARKEELPSSRLRAMWRRSSSTRRHWKNSTRTNSLKPHLSTPGASSTRNRRAR